MNCKTFVGISCFGSTAGFTKIQAVQAYRKHLYPSYAPEAVYSLFGDQGTPTNRTKM